MSFNRLSTDEIDELKHLVRRELNEAENRLMNFLPQNPEAESFTELRTELIDNLTQKKASLHSILGKLDRFHQSEVRRYYQNDHYNSGYNQNSGYNNYQQAGNSPGSNGYQNSSYQSDTYND